jgi:hypothetical protein
MAGPSQNDLAGHVPFQNMLIAETGAFAQPLRDA